LWSSILRPILLLCTVHVFGLCVFCLEIGSELLTECKWTDLVGYDGVEIPVLDWLSCLLSLHVLLTTAAQRMDMMHVHTMYVCRHSSLDGCNTHCMHVCVDYTCTYIPPSLVPW